LVLHIGLDRNLKSESITMNNPIDISKKIISQKALSYFEILELLLIRHQNQKSRIKNQKF